MSICIHNGNSIRMMFLKCHNISSLLHVGTTQFCLRNIKAQLLVSVLSLTRYIYLLNNDCNFPLKLYTKYVNDYFQITLICYN